MAPRQKIKVEGFRDLDKALGELGKRTGKNVLRRAARTAMEPMRAEAERLAPVRTGRLADGIAISTKLSRSQRKSARDYRATVLLHMGPAASAPHAVPEEFGTLYHAPQPYMRPAWDSQGQATLERLKAELRKEIDKATARAARKAKREAAKLAKASGG